MVAESNGNAAKWQGNAMECIGGSASLVRIIRGGALFEEELNPKSAEDERNAIP
jgi:hypothetical protein